MGHDGDPELSTKRCGEKIGQLRTAQRLSRRALINRLARELTDDDPLQDIISEQWLARLETGRTVKLPRLAVLALCKALRCNPQEQRIVLMLADRNVLADEDGTVAPAHELLLDFALHLFQHPIAMTMIELALAKREVKNLSQEEVLLLINDIIKFVVQPSSSEQFATSSSHANLSSEEAM